MVARVEGGENCHTLNNFSTFFLCFRGTVLLDNIVVKMCDPDRSLAIVIRTSVDKLIMLDDIIEVSL